MKTTQISREALGPISGARQKAIDLANAAERAIKDARLAELEYKVLIQQMYLDNKLESNCRVDLASGTVTWPEEAPEEPSLVKYGSEEEA
jgi:hypothetical protein